MQTFYYYMVLLGTCTQFAQTSYFSFRGSGQGAKFLLSIGTILGLLSFLAIIITSFFFITWWHTLLLAVATVFIAGLTSSIARNPFIGLLSCVGVIVFSVLAWMGMLSSD